MVPARLVPRERPPRVRVDPAHDADLVAVVGARRAGQRRLEQDGELHRLAIAAEQREDPRRVVAVEEVQLDGVRLRRVGAEQLGEPGAEARPVEPPGLRRTRGATGASGSLRERPPTKPMIASASG